MAKPNREGETQVETQAGFQAQIQTEEWSRSKDPQVGG